VAIPRTAAPKRARARRQRPARGGVAARQVALSADERALLLRACARYRGTLPSYLASARSELRALARLERKLASRHA
jgi:hypothetical protein